MSTKSNKVANSTSTAMAGQELRAQAEALGAELQDGFAELIAILPNRITGPQALADALEGINSVSAGRLLKAIAQKDPIATLQLLPGPKPLQQVIDASKRLQIEEEAIERAETATREFDGFIREQAGDRSTLKAMLTAWLPEERKEFESQRRQTIFKARQELDGVSSDLELNAMVIHPSEDPGHLDLVNVKCLFGIDRIRPEATVTLGTALAENITEHSNGDSNAASERLPRTLEGDVAHDGFHSVLLSEFCTERIAPLQVHPHGTHVDYTLGPTGFGRASKVDLVLAEVNPKGLVRSSPDMKHPPHFWVIPEMCTRKMVFDIILHEDVYTERSPVLRFYDTKGLGIADPSDPRSDRDRRDFSHSIEVIG
ncbi:MAG: hypothetical protein P1V35_16435, partial [Planctomycetota bacterium]|nr:hypothetical protein [Planctomycetota bacterium]